MKILRLLSGIVLGLIAISLILGNIFYAPIRTFIDNGMTLVSVSDDDGTHLKKLLNPDYTMAVSTDKNVYDKFEKVQVIARIQARKGSKIPQNSVIEVQFFKKGQPVRAIGGNDKTRLYYNADQKIWTAYWYPESSGLTGNLEIQATGYLDSPEAPSYAETSIFLNQSEPNFVLKKGLAFIGIDSLERISKQHILSVEGKEVDWSYIPDWVNFVSADGILMLGGVTKTFMDTVTLDSPWDNDKINEAVVLADRLRQKGRTFGTWLRGFRVEGADTKKMGYKPGIIFNGDKWSEERSFVSVLDDNRKKSVTKLFQSFMDNDVVSYVGISDLYLNDDQGFELIDLFANDLHYNLPDGWEKMDFSQKFQSFESRLKDPAVAANFRKWKDYIISEYIRDLIADGGHKKPIFYYVDYTTLMANPNLLEVILNSGVDFAVVNFNVNFMDIKSDMDKFSQNEKISGNFNRIIISYNIDYKNVDISDFDLSAIENYVHANLQVVKYGSEKMNAKGIMINDLYKAMSGNRGPYSPNEWMMGVGETIYRFKEINQVLPMEFDFSIPSEVSFGQKFDADVQILNISAKAIANLKVDFLPIMGSPQKSTAIPNVPAGKEIDISAPLQIDTNSNQFMRKKSFVGLRFSWTDGDDKTGVKNNGFILFHSVNLKDINVVNDNTNLVTNQQKKGNNR